MGSGHDTSDGDLHNGLLVPLTREVTRGLGARTSFLAVPPVPEAPLDVVAAWSSAPPWDREAPPREGSFVTRARATRGVTLGPVAADDDSLGNPEAGSPITWGAAAPVRPFRAPPGLLCAGFPAPPDCDHSLLRWMLDAYAQIAALCVAQPTAVHGLVLAARYDGTTGCLSHTAIHDEIQREIQRAERHGTPLACCFLDLDRFKQVNDRLGHLEGTRVLQRVATILRSGLRTTDVIGRYGGDEFVLVLPDCTEEGGLELTQRLRELLSAPGATTPPGETPVEVSVGVAAWTPGLGCDGLLRAADTALMRAKHNGGGDVVPASTLDSAPPAA